ncbi:MAG TPA: HEPN domain-containing protein [Acidobacteriota bacterium]|nr:HEPN domain-containing protein [Acidobacteriota bacterium]
MNDRDLTQYRLRLAEGFLREAEQDFQLERWRSCVDNAQLAVENAGKAVLALFGVIPKTHDPARQVAQILRTKGWRKNNFTFCSAPICSSSVVGPWVSPG